MPLEQPAPRTATDTEIADWQYTHKDELDAEGGEPIDASVSHPASLTMSFRLSGEEAETIRDSAAAADVSASHWIREACRAHARRDQQPPSEAVVALASAFAQGLRAAGARLELSDSPAVDIARLNQDLRDLTAS